MGRFVNVVAPFMGAVKGKQGAKDVSEQLQTLINAYAKKSREFCSVSEVNIENSPGYIGSLFGRNSEYTKYAQVIFR